MLITCNGCGKSWRDTDRETDLAHCGGCPKWRGFWSQVAGLILVVMAMAGLLAVLANVNGIR